MRRSMAGPPPSAARRCSLSASPPAAATTAAPAASSSVSGSGARRRHDQRRRLDVRGAGLPAVGRALQGRQGLTVNYQAVGSGAGIAQFTAGTVDFGGTDPALKDEEIKAAKKKGAPVQVPTVARRDHRLLQPRRRREGPQARRRDDRRHLPRQDQEVERPGDRGAEPGRRACRHRHHGRATAPTRRARPRASPSFLAAYSPSGRAARASTRPSSGRPAPAPRATTASPPREADRRRRRLRRAGLRAAEQLHLRSREEQVGQVHRADARRRRRRPATASRSRRTCASATINSPNPTAYPIRSQTFMLVYKDLVQGRASSEARPRRSSRTGSTTRSATGRRSPRSSSTRRCPADIKTKARGQGRRPARATATALTG